MAALMGLVFTGCEPKEEPQPLYGVEVTDVDSDGYFADYEDCDDNDPTAYPGAAPEDSETACMQDFDGDGYGNAVPENSAVEAGTDCDDNDVLVNPGAGNCPNE